MANNYVNPGAIWTHRLTEAIVSGGIVVMGETAGIAVTSGNVGDEVAVAVAGNFSIPKNNTVSFSQGVSAYWDVENNEAVATADGNIYLGRVSHPADEASTEVWVAMNMGGPVVA